MALADFFAIDLDNLRVYFDEVDGDLRVTIDPTMLGPTVAERVRSIALLLIVGRQIGHYDYGPTDASVVRAECERYRVLDTNFSAHMNKVDRMLVVKMVERSKMYALTPSARKTARQLMARIASS